MQQQGRTAHPPVGLRQRAWSVAAARTGRGYSAPRWHGHACRYLASARWRSSAGQTGKLVRTPDLKEQTAPCTLINPRAAVDAGVAPVVQDVRGAGMSGGAFEPLVHEGVDGIDTVDWNTHQSWSNGKVVMAGHSYLGAVQCLTTARSNVRELGFLATWVATCVAPAVYQWWDDPEATVCDVAGLKQQPASDEASSKRLGLDTTDYVDGEETGRMRDEEDQS